MVICLLCYRGNPYCGGQGIYLKHVAEELARQGHEVHALVGPPYPMNMKGVTVHHIHNNEYFIKKGKAVINPQNPLDIFTPINFYEYFNSRFGAFTEISSFSYRAYLKIKELLKCTPIDIIHDNQCLGYGLLLMKTLGVPVIATIHHPLTIDLQGILERVNTFYYKFKTVMFYPVVMQKIVSKRLDHVITVSEDAKKKIYQDFGVPLEKQTVVYNGLDRTIFHRIKNVEKINNKVLFVGNVEDTKKGFVFLLRALKHVKSRINLTVVDGGAPHRKATYKHIKRLGLEGMINFTGKVTTDELVRHYNESEIAVVPSVYEGFGFPAAEAMSCGVPVIASNGGALPEVVGDAGITVNVKDDISLAAALDMLISDKKKLKELGQKGVERVTKNFNWEEAVRQIVNVYRIFC